MKLIDAKFGMAVHVGGKEVNYAGTPTDGKPPMYAVEVVYVEELQMSVVQVTLLQGTNAGAMAWTSFANVVYCRPEEGTVLESTSSKKGLGNRKAGSANPSAQA